MITLAHCRYKDHGMTTNDAIAAVPKIHTKTTAVGPVRVLNRMASIPVASATLPPAMSRSILFTLRMIRQPLSWSQTDPGNCDGPGKFPDRGVELAGESFDCRGGGDA